MKQVVTYGLVTLVVAVGFARLAYYQVEAANSATSEPTVIVAAPSVTDLSVTAAKPDAAIAKRAPRALKFHLYELASGDIVLAPKYRDTLPATIHTTVNVKKRKTMFIDTLLPIILKTNDAILQDRARLQTLKDKQISDADRAWINKLAKKYRVDIKSKASTSVIDRLLVRVDIIPPSLAMSQAVMESGWGTSRFARLGNALFGQWVWGDGEGILPEDRKKGATHRIKSFKTIAASVADYMRNLNSHPAYKSLRARRAELRKHGLAVTGNMLAPGLTGYSERGEKYVTEILSIISFNKLGITDVARLARSGELEGVSK